ncbi:pseudouridylate synthase 7 homolog [Euwallacea fornicatus]|uniref:pseudouridylate synthase 7 homolog n=1 Tax=Euwallacea fornicatus TaxID=995702 RepID=UPI00338EF5A7
MSFTRKYKKKSGGFQNQRNCIRNDSSGSFNFGRRKNENSQYKHQDQLSEKDVGISEYISDLEGYSAVIKARFSDFQVNEINKEGKLAKLTQLSVPNFTPSTDSELYKDTVESPMEKIPQDVWNSLRNLIKTNDVDCTVELDAENLTKDERRDIHQCIKTYFGTHLVASTIKKNEKTTLSFKKWDKKEKSNRSEWPKNTPEFVHFIVYKEMMDTMDACFKISQALKIPVAKIYYAGLKDRRAKTTQWCCVKKYQPSKLIASLRNVRNLKVGNIEFKEKCLKLGDLSGNRFRIALRNVQAEDDLINRSLSHVKEHGFINYYGLQRFGNEKEVPTYLIGIKLLTGSWKTAINLILKVKSGDDRTQIINTAKQIYADTGDAAKALKVCDKRQNGLEKKLLEGLAKHHGNDYVNALDSIPRSIRLMYIHAFQSLVWNKMASKRIKLFGLNPVEGDLVLIDKMDEEGLKGNENDEEEIEDYVTAETIKNRLIARPLTAEELHNYSIFDIVLPLPGFDIIYPENLKQLYKEVLEGYGLSLEMPKQKVKTYNLSGTYRKLVQQVQDVEWKIMYYNNSTDNLIQSDLEELKGEALPESIENGTYKAVVIAFTLNSASYATMVLREVLKCNTSSSSQAGLNNYDTTQTAQIDANEPQDSLLADTEKYKDFQKRIFSEISEEAENCGMKQELSDGGNESQSKKIKTTN